MNPEFIPSIIEATGTVLASIIGVSGVFFILKNRQDIIKLSKEVEAYHTEKGSEGGKGV